MAAIVRCDSCKKLSDEPAVGYIGRRFEVIDLTTSRYAKVLMSITATSDFCIECIKKLVAENRLREETKGIRIASES